MSKHLRGIAHHLDPVVTVGDGGLSDNVLAELDRALADHELIKVRLLSADKAERKTLGEHMAQAAKAEVVQRIGKIVVLHRANPSANPKLSNIARHGRRK